MRLLCTVALVLSGIAGFAQSNPLIPNDRPLLYVTWGYHRDEYSKSTIHFRDTQTDNYNFTFHHARAKDQVDVKDLFHTPLTVPQYVLNVGVMFKDKKKGWGIEFSWDHLKYVVIDDQVMHLTGNIRGQNFDQDTLVTRPFVHFEHTNGNNYAMISAVRQMRLLATKSGDQSINALFKAGAGVLVPKTDSYIMGMHNDGPFKLSGMVVGVSANIRYVTLRYLFFEAGLKGAFADYTHAKLVNKGYAQHSFFSIQYIGSAGLCFPL